ncbi:hypothetical protein [Chryseobacterium bernardetii]|uniref:hypothetical protein n=1 Tax=Chryseobacterium bernardetii TaxID=1241978 RepID=UPI000F4ED821|nr:hypothetical protein [Chryseobacterium bernardetii]AZB34797.1 hypothetical protein EG351_15050 [Chryseobacterium bernardetii]
MGKHHDFILSPISNILKEVISANSGIGFGIETYPLSEYIMQAVFLKMTGFQEQKMKCICWELATDDYEYRYKRYTLNPLGECSSYREKNFIYTDLVDLIKKYEQSFTPHMHLNKDNIHDDTVSEIKELFSTSILSSWSENTFSDFINDRNVIPKDQFIAQNQGKNILFQSTLTERYELLYHHRNRCAHNTLSYQENLPTLTMISQPNYRYDTYFVRFSLLLLIDKIFIELYKKYKATNSD